MTTFFAEKSYSSRCLRMRKEVSGLTNAQDNQTFVQLPSLRIPPPSLFLFSSFFEENKKHTIGHWRMNFRGQSRESPLSLTPQFDEHKKCSERLSGVQKDARAFQKWREKGRRKVR